MKETVGMELYSNYNLPYQAKFSENLWRIAYLYLQAISSYLLKIRKL